MKRILKEKIAGQVSQEADRLKSKQLEVKKKTSRPPISLTQTPDSKAEKEIDALRREIKELREKVCGRINKKKHLVEELERAVSFNRIQEQEAEALQAECDQEVRRIERLLEEDAKPGQKRKRCMDGDAEIGSKLVALCNACEWGDLEWPQHTAPDADTRRVIRERLRSIATLELAAESLVQRR